MARRRTNVEDVPLEVRSRLDWAWYDGTVSKEDSKMRIHFKGFDSADDEVWDEHFTRDPDKLTDLIRLRSKQLQDSDCTKVRKNMIVCAMYTSVDGRELKYYDAKVIEIRVGSHVHSTNRQGKDCNCSFLIEYAEGPPRRDRALVGCGDISFVDEGSIAIHPVAGELLQEARKSRTPVSRGGRKKGTLVSRGTDDIQITDDIGELSPDYAERLKNFDSFLTKLAGSCTSFEAAFNEFHGEVIDGAPSLRRDSDGA